MRKHVQKVKTWSRPKKVALGVGAFTLLTIALAAGSNQNQTALNTTNTDSKSSA